jgi:hypothetical protein
MKEHRNVGFMQSLAGLSQIAEQVQEATVQLQRITRKPYELLPSGILIVEPHPGLLKARALLLSAADCYLAITNVRVPGTELAGIQVKVAILSQSLGKETLASLAQDVRVYWPCAHILIFGTPSTDFEDSLYDTTISHRCRPEELLDALFRLSEGSQDSDKDSSDSPEDGSLMLPAINGSILRHVPTESDPTKQIESNSIPPPSGGGFPSGESHASSLP